jgi:hypothetical protein
MCDFRTPAGTRRVSPASLVTARHGPIAELDAEIIAEIEVFISNP